MDAGEKQAETRKQGKVDICTFSCGLARGLLLGNPHLARAAQRYVPHCTDDSQAQNVSILYKGTELGSNKSRHLRGMGMNII